MKVFLKMFKKFLEKKVMKSIKKKIANASKEELDKAIKFIEDKYGDKIKNIKKEN